MILSPERAQSSARCTTHHHYFYCYSQWLSAGLWVCRAVGVQGCGYRLTGVPRAAEGQQKGQRSLYSLTILWKRSKATEPAEAWVAVGGNHGEEDSGTVPSRPLGPEDRELTVQ